VTVPTRTLIDDLLAEQQRFTTVERFARKHEKGDVPAQARYYRDLIPTAKPVTGQQYAFAVDLDACTGCKACVSACHSLNGLDDKETWRSTGLLVGGTSIAYQQTITTACHHCVEPGCLEGCPVMAYEKDADTGIVRHLDDQCIGCQYCVLKCPYDVPKYSKRLGIVRKCDMCIDRLVAGEAPACVQACPHEAIRIELVDKAEVSRAAAPGASMVPGAFDSSYTKPTTRYTSARGLPTTAQPADTHDLRLEHAHWPLILMLLLTQTGAGLFVTLFVAATLGATTTLPVLATAGFLALNAGLAVSVLHLGRPLGAWRFFLGLRTSWMSREILSFGIFAAVAAACLATMWVPALFDLRMITAGATAGRGLFSVFTSGMIYVDTRREAWRAELTHSRFFGTTLLMGATAAAAVLAVGTKLGWTELGEAGVVAAVVATVIRTALFVWERRAPIPERSRRAVNTLLPWLPRMRAWLFGISTVAGVLALNPWGAEYLLGVVALVSTALSQLLERYAFFTTVTAPRMPGGVPT
jgi:formate dehydrogenase iron-sulfur subunit